MHNHPLNALLVEDSPTDAQLFQHVFYHAAPGHWSLKHVETLGEAIACCQTDTFQVALLDLRLPDSEGLETVIQFAQAAPDLPIIILTVFDDEELALQAMAKGAQDYLVKDQVTTQLLRRTIRYALERVQILQQLKDSKRVTLEALAKERELNQLKSHFISMVSHEFRNPLSTLRVISEMLLRFDQGLSSDKKALYFDQINLTINHMCHLLDEVILLGRAESGKLDLELTQVNLREFCEGLVMSMQFSDNEQHPIALHYQGESDSVELDLNLLRHVLGNLISNALKYSPVGKTVDLTVHLQDTQVLFEVRDRGIGIPPQDQHRLFDTFSRCSNVGQVPGTGLGLAIVKRCVELYGGEISLVSELNVGTTLTVSLPLVVRKTVQS